MEHENIPKDDMHERNAPVEKESRQKAAVNERVRQ